ncbi:MAG: hypothetical protein K9H25_17270 [Rhodospirillum sp.]|nr:hypothetical protein [Rhodospirillum sp.]MCF8502106.1 hypothetical protein [Rhodospirillum sp.]
MIEWLNNAFEFLPWPREYSIAVIAAVVLWCGWYLPQMRLFKITVLSIALFFCLTALIVFGVSSLGL